MALKAHVVPGKKKSEVICNAFVKGAPAGVNGHVFCGVTEANIAAYNAALASKLPVYVVENSYFDCVRGEQFRITKNAMQFTGEAKSDCKRFDALGITIRPRKATCGRLLTVAQSALYMRIIAHDPMWVMHKIAKVFDHDTWTEIRGRPWNRDKRSAARSLPEDLHWADGVLTHSSAAAIEAVLAGIPVFTSPECAAHEFTAVKDWPDRRQWAGVLADRQFTIEEMRNGTAWAMLHRDQ